MRMLKWEKGRLALILAVLVVFVTVFENAGLCVFAQQQIPNDSFVPEYAGEEGEELELDTSGEMTYYLDYGYGDGSQDDYGRQSFDYGYNVFRGQVLENKPSSEKVKITLPGREELAAMNAQEHPEISVNKNFETNEGDASANRLETLRYTLPSDNIPIRWKYVSYINKNDESLSTIKPTYCSYVLIPQETQSIELEYNSNLVSYQCYVETDGTVKLPGDESETVSTLSLPENLVLYGWTLVEHNYNAETGVSELPENSVIYKTGTNVNSSDLSDDLYAVLTSRDTITSISAAKIKTEYVQNESLELSDLVVSGVDYDGNSITIPADQYVTNADSIDMTTLGDKVLEITYKNILGDELKTEIGFTVKEEEKLQSINQNLTLSVENGTALSAMKFPTTVGITTSTQATKTAAVDWKLASPVYLNGTSYDPAIKTEQNFQLQGTVSCPEGLNANGVLLTTKINVTVGAAAQTDPTLITKICMSKNRLTLTEGTTGNLKVSITPEEATNKKVTWKSSNTKIATVSLEGKVTAVKPGTATITCETKDGSKLKAICKLTVKEATSKKQEISVSAKATEKEIQVNWAKMKGVDGYFVYGAKCGETPKKLKTITKASTTSWTHKNIDNGSNYKYTVMGYKKNGNKKKVIVTSMQLHIATPGSSSTNVKEVKTDFSSATINKGKTKQIKATSMKEDESKPLVSHVAEFRYLSSNNSIATVTENGKIKAVKKGICYIYVYANDCVSKKIRIKVK